MDIEQGSSDGIDLSSTRVAFAFDLPGDFIGGNGIARVYIDQGANQAQRRELEAILTGKKDGVFEGLAAIVTRWLPMQTTSINIDRGENPAITVGSVGQVRLEALKTADGRQTKLVNAPLAAEFGFESIDLHRSNGSRWSDPEMRQWEAGGHGEVASFNWRA